MLRDSIFFYKNTKDRRSKDYIANWILINDQFYLGLRPTVDTALIPPLSHPVLEN